MSAHTQTSDSAHLRVAESAIVRIHIFHQLFADEGFKLEFWVDRRIEIPTVLTVGAHNHHAIFSGNGFQIFLCGPVAITAPCAVKHIHSGETVGGIVEMLIWQHHHRLDATVHLLAHHFHGVGLHVHHLHLGGYVLLCARQSHCSGKQHK